MQMFYNSEQFAVVRFGVPSDDDTPVSTAEGESQGPVIVGGHEPMTARLPQGGFEIVDKQSRMEVFLEGALAETFHDGVQALVADNPTEEALDEYIGRFTMLAQQPVVMH